MNDVRYLSVLVAVSMLCACTDSNVTSNVPDMQPAASDMAEDMHSTSEDMGDDPTDMPEDGVDMPERMEMGADVDMNAMPPDDMDADQGMDMTCEEDMPEEGLVELPLEQTFDFDQNEGDFRRGTAEFTLAPQPEGVLVLRVSWDTDAMDAPQRPIDVEFCTDGRCVGSQSNALRVEGARHIQTYAWESLPDETYAIEISAFAPSDITTVSADISLTHLPWQDIAGNPTWASQAITVSSPAALRGVLPGGSVSTNPNDYTTHWFSWDASAPGASGLSKIGGDSFEPVLCESDTTQAPWICASEGSTRRLEISRAGTQRFVLQNPYEQEAEYRVVFLYEPFQDALACGAGEHPDGADACIAQDSCASGFHDGGQGSCVPDGECDPGFELDDQGACFGWFYEGNIPSVAEIETFWSSTNEIIELSDGRFFNTNNLDETDTLPDRSRPLIFDPATASWSASQTEEPTPSVYRSCALADGRVLAVGYGSPTDPNQKIERIYDPASDTWKDLTDVSGVVWGNSVMCRLLRDGRTLVTSSGTRTKVFDASTEQWADFPGFPSEYRGRFLTELADGTLVTGVESALGSPDEVMILRANATEWEAIANWPMADTPVNDYTRFWVCGANEFCTWGSNGGTKYNAQTNQPSALQSPAFGAPGAFIEDTSGVYLALTTQGIAQYTAATDSWSKIAPRPFGCLAMALEPATGDILCAHNYVTRFVR